MVVYFVCGTWYSVHWAEIMGKSLWGSSLEIAPVRVFDFFSLGAGSRLAILLCIGTLGAGLWVMVGYFRLISSIFIARLV